MKKFLSKVLPISLAAVLVLGMLPAVGVKATESNQEDDAAEARVIDTVSITFLQPTEGDEIKSEGGSHQYGKPIGIIMAGSDDYYLYDMELIDSCEIGDNGVVNFMGNPYEITEGERYMAGKTYYFRSLVCMNYNASNGARFAGRNQMKVEISASGATAVVGPWSDESGSESGWIYGSFTVKAVASEETKPAEEKKEEAAAETETKEETPAAPFELKILDGADQEVDGTGDVTIRANGEFANFDKLLMDGVEVDPTNYTSKEGSTIVILKSSYVASLGTGAHTVTFEYKDGSTVKTSLTLKTAGNTATPAAENTSTSTTESAPAAAPAATATEAAPKTGENNMWMMYAILLMSVAAMGVTAVSIKRNK